MQGHVIFEVPSGKTFGEPFWLEPSLTNLLHELRFMVPTGNVLQHSSESLKTLPKIRVRPLKWADLPLESQSIFHLIPAQPVRSGWNPSSTKKYACADNQAPGTPKESQRKPKNTEVWRCPFWMKGNPKGNHLGCPNIASRPILRGAEKGAWPNCTPSGSLGTQRANRLGEEPTKRL